MKRTRLLLAALMAVMMVIVAFDLNPSISLRLTSDLAEPNRSVVGSETTLSSPRPSWAANTALAKGDHPSPFGSKMGSNQQHQIQDLEFVHIPKTAGTAIESIGRAAGIAWGLCAFHPWGYGNCPRSERHVKMFVTKAKDWHFGCPLWHIPPKVYFETIKNDTLHPYRNRTMFGIVRNPYTRTLSEYYFYMQLVRKLPPNETHDPGRLNQFVTRHLKAVNGSTPDQRKYFLASGHWIPQYDYVFDSDGKQIIQHVLRYESLDQHFADLVALYRGSDNPQNASMELPRPDSVRNETTKELSAADFDVESLELIRHHFKNDFEAFGYSMDDLHVE